MKKHSLPYNNRTGFKAPEGYFDSLEERIMDSVRTGEIEKDLPGHGFGMPEGYLDSFEGRLLKRVGRRSFPESKAQSNLRRLVSGNAIKYAAAVAAVLLVIGSLLQTNQSPASDSLETIDLLTLEGYLQEARETPNSNLQFIIAEEQDTMSSEDDDIIIEQEALLEYLKEHIDEPSILYYED